MPPSLVESLDVDEPEYLAYLFWIGPLMYIRIINRVSNVISTVNIVSHMIKMSSKKKAIERCTHYT